MRVLVTGGTGKLGQELLPKLSQAGHDVVALSRRPLASGIPASYAPGDLASGEGIDEAVKGAEAIVHAATGGFGNRYSMRWAVFHRAAVDVRGTKMLLEAAERTRIRHFVFTSIVGMDRVPYWPTVYRYFKHKLEAERLVRASSVPWTIARTTQFFPFLDEMMAWAFGRRLGPVMLPETLGQPIDPSDVADAAVECVEGNAANDIVEFGGPEVLTWREIVEPWASARGTKRKARFFRAPGKLGRAWREGALTCPENSRGRVTWEKWLSRHHG